MDTKPIIAYIRVSTKAQGDSGLGLEGQESAIAKYALSTNSNLLFRYVEVESGKRNDRPELKKALAHARRSKATLVVAKLDRLARNVAFLSTLLESDVPFVACDNPQANRLTIHILAAVAENEALVISERTKAALKAYKARGGLLGSQRPECRGNLSPSARAKGVKAAARKTYEATKAAYQDVRADILDTRASGTTLQGIASHLNQSGHSTRGGKPWSAMQVLRVLRICDKV